LDYEKFCSQILDKDPKIRFATVYDEWAVRVGGGMRKGLENFLSEHAENELVNISILDWKARKDMSKWLGKTKYTLAEYDKVNRFSFYLGDDYLLLVSAEKDHNTNVVVDEVIKLYYENQN
jgi:ATP-dependent exoDNAse (exonuclease V) alpha subunit